MINYNGLVTDSAILSTSNRGFLYGDSVFDTILYSQNKFHFLEEHYFRLMSAMRIMRMAIPNYFTQDFWEEELTKTISSPSEDYRIRTTVYRCAAGKYTPDSLGEIEFLIESEKHTKKKYSEYKLDVFPDHFISPNLLSSIKTNNKATHILAGIWAKENGLDNCIILNSRKEVCEAISHNIFILNSENEYITPPLESGCLNGVYRKKVLALLTQKGFTVKETPISVFSMQKAKNIFLTNSIEGILPVTQFKKVKFTNRIDTTAFEKELI